MQKLMLVAAVAAGFGMITEPTFAAPHARGRNDANHRAANRAPVRANAGHHRAAPARRSVAAPVRRHVRPVVVRSRVVGRVRRPAVVHRVAPVIRRPFVPAFGYTAPVYDSFDVSYQMYAPRTLSQLSYAAAVELVNELRSLGAYAEIRNGFGGYEVVYSMNGSQVRTFGSRAAVIDFETRLARFGMQIL